MKISPITIILLLIFILLIILVKKYRSYEKDKSEHLDSTSQQQSFNSTEAIATLSSLYNNNTLTLTNVNITGNQKIDEASIGNASIENINANNMIGIIVMWSGPIAYVPTGWVICDGREINVKDSTGTIIKLNTPDLRGKFVYGYDSSNNSLLANTIGNTGGEETHLLINDEMPKHTHYGIPQIGNNRWKHGSAGGDVFLFYAPPNILNISDIKMTASGDAIDSALQFNPHDGAKVWKGTQKIKIGKNTFNVPPSRTDLLNDNDAYGGKTFTGGDMAHNNMPPYYVLAYIMKIDETIQDNYTKQPQITNTPQQTSNSTILPILPIPPIQQLPLTK